MSFGVLFGLVWLVAVVGSVAAATVRAWREPPARPRGRLAAGEAARRGLSWEQAAQERGMLNLLPRSGPEAEIRRLKDRYVRDEIELDVFEEYVGRALNL